MAQLTDDLFDAIEFDAASCGDHLTAALRMSRLASTGEPAGGMSDDPAEAADAFRQAIADGGHTFVDPRVPLARALYLLDQPEQAGRIIEQLKTEGPTDPRVCDLVAELLLERADLPGALAWVTAGVELCLPDGAADIAAESTQVVVSRDRFAELRLLLNLRYRIRNDLALPEDGYDRLIDRLETGS